jgi:hypothetical protein
VEHVCVAEAEPNVQKDGCAVAAGRGRSAGLAGALGLLAGLLVLSRRARRR